MDRTVDMFATYLYIYLLPRRINNIPGLRTYENWATTGTFSEFSEDIGKSILLHCYRNQSLFWLWFAKHTPGLQQKEEEEACKHIYNMLLKFRTSLMGSIFGIVCCISAFLLELAAFMSAIGKPDSVWFIDRIWAHFFQEYLAECFYERGSWKVLRAECRRDAAIYDQMCVEWDTTGQPMLPDGWLNGEEKYCMAHMKKTIRNLMEEEWLMIKKRNLPAR